MFAYLHILAIIKKRLIHHSLFSYPSNYWDRIAKGLALDWRNNCKGASTGLVIRSESLGCNPSSIPIGSKGEDILAELTYAKGLLVEVMLMLGFDSEGKLS